MDKFFKYILERDNEELIKCNEWQNEQINRVIEKINNCLNGERKTACIPALIERLSCIVVSMGIDIETQLGHCNKMIRHYVNEHKKDVK